METNHYPSVLPSMLPALEAALEGHQEAMTEMASFRKKYTYVKNKVKRIEQYLVTMEEQDRRIYELGMIHSVQLAENKFTLINKKLHRIAEQESTYVDQSIELLKGSDIMEPTTVQWHIQSIASYTQRLNRLLYEVTDMLRIAKGHLHKVDDMKKTLAQYRKLRRPR